MEDWKQVIFTDESKFVMGYGNKGPRVWRQKYERHKAACLKHSVKHPASNMVWGCVSSQGVGSLCFLSPKTTVNTEVYIDLLDAYLLPSVDKLFADDDFVFQHDLAPAHSSTPNFLMAHSTTFLGTLSKAFSRSTNAHHSSLCFPLYLSCNCLAINIA